MSKTNLTLSEQWESLTLANNFIFCKVMESNPDLCKHLLEILLHVEIDHLEPPQAERTFQEAVGSRGVRFDVYAKDESRIFDIEIQTVSKKNLPKRARYYQSVIDVSNLNSGVNYAELKDTYIIFICLNDLFRQKLPVYTFENICKENNEIKLRDGAFKVFFNAKECDRMRTSEEKAFFNFLKGRTAEDDFTKSLEEKVLLVKKNLEWRNQYMTFKEQFAEEFDEAREMGFAEGIEQGIEKGIEQGAQQTAIETAKKFLQMQLVTPEQIAQGCSLSLEEVLSLKQELELSV